MQTLRELEDLEGHSMYHTRKFTGSGALQRGTNRAQHSLEVDCLRHEVEQELRASRSMTICVHGAVPAFEDLQNPMKL